MTGTVVAIWIKRSHRGVMDPVDEAEAIAGQGLSGNADRSRRRQVTIIDETAWNAAAAETGHAVDPSKRRANIMLRGIGLEQSRGRHLRIGRCLIHILGETTPCERMEEAQTGLRDALRPARRAGVFGEIVEGGPVRLGDTAELT
jgi:MOSC domain-containing protein YiiM